MAVLEYYKITRLSNEYVGKQRIDLVLEYYKITRLSNINNLI